MAALPLLADGLCMFLCPSFRANAPYRLPKRLPPAPYQSRRHNSTESQKAEQPNGQSNVRYYESWRNYDDSARKGSVPLTFQVGYNEKNAQWSYVPESYVPDADAAWKSRSQLQGHRLYERMSVQELYEMLFTESTRADPGLVWLIVDHLVCDRHEQPNRRVYSSMIRACSSPRRGGAAMLRELIKEIDDEGIELDSGLCHDIIEALSVHPDHLLLNAILDHMRDKWFNLNDKGHHFVAASLLRDKQFELAMERLDLMGRSNIRIEPWIHNMLYYTLANLGEHTIEEAFNIIRLREKPGQTPITSAMWLHFLDFASRAQHYEGTIFVWRKRVENAYLNPPVGVCFHVLATAAKAGDAQLATDVFRKLAAKKVPFDKHHYELLLETYIAAHDIRSAFSILSIMNRANLVPDTGSTRSLFVHLKSAPDLPATAMSHLRDIRAKGQQSVPIPAIDVVIEAAIELGKLDDALGYYRAIPEICIRSPATSTYNILLRGCTQTRRKDLALQLAQTMVDEKCPPNALTYDRLVLVCLKDEDDWELGMMYYKEMVSRAWWPRLGTFKNIVYKLVDVGDERAGDVLRDMLNAGLPLAMELRAAVAQRFGTENMEKWTLVVKTPVSKERVPDWKAGVFNAA